MDPQKVPAAEAASHSAPASPRDSKMVPTTGASSSTPDKTNLSNAEIQLRVEKLKNKMLVLHSNIYENNNNYIEDVDNLINVLLNMKILKLQEIGQDGTVSEVYANTLFSNTIPQKITDLSSQETPTSNTKPSEKNIGLESVRDNVLALPLPLPGERRVSIPDKFLCPISKKLMTDPVVLANGETCDRRNIESYLERGIWICPITHEVLESDLLIPNFFARNAIYEWCRKTGVNYPKTQKDDVKIDISFEYLPLMRELERLEANSPEDMVEAAARIRKITKEWSFARRYFGQYPQKINRLISLIICGEVTGIPCLGEYLIASVVNILAEDDRNKQIFGGNPYMLPMLINLLRNGRTISTICHAAQAICLLSSVEENLIDLIMAIELLTKLVVQGHPSAMRAASRAILNLCHLDSNLASVIAFGGVKIILDKLKAHIVLDSFIRTLARLSYHQDALPDLASNDAVAVLQKIINNEKLVTLHQSCHLIIQKIKVYIAQDMANTIYRQNVGEPSEGAIVPSRNPKDPSSSALPLPLPAPAPAPSEGAIRPSRNPKDPSSSALPLPLPAPVPSEGAIRPSRNSEDPSSSALPAPAPSGGAISPSRNPADPSSSALPAPEHGS